MNCIPNGGRTALVLNKFTGMGDTLVSYERVARGSFFR